jgi:small subunit ribosomal protein S17
MTDSSDNRKQQRKVRTGVVISNKMDKTVVVEVSRTVMHPVYKKFVRRRKRFMAHDEENRCQIGDQVMIVETRPLSRHKNWRVRKIVKEAALPGGAS